MATTIKKLTPLAAPHGFDQHGLPIGVATFTKEQVKQTFNLTDRQLRRYDVTGVLRAFRPAGPKSPPMYKRADLVAWLER